METLNDNKVNNPEKSQVHGVLAHSYLLYFVVFLVGLFVDLNSDFGVFKSPIMVPIGFSILALASVIIVWAQHTNRHLPQDKVNKEMFCRGPYCYTRNPTHWGVFFMMVGFGIIVDAPFVILFVTIYFFITKHVFLHKQDQLLLKKYGSHFEEYKKSVKF